MIEPTAENCALAYLNPMTFVKDFHFSDPSAKGSLGVWFNDRTEIPAVPCVYIVARYDGAILYVGESVDARSRHQLHEREDDFLDHGAARIYWEEYSSKSEVKTREKEILGQIRTPLNKQGFEWAADVPVHPDLKGKVTLICNLQLLKKVVTATFDRYAGLFRGEMITAGPGLVAETLVGRYLKVVTVGHFTDPEAERDFKLLEASQESELAELKKRHKQEREAQLAYLTDQGKYHTKQGYDLMVSPAGMLAPNPDLINTLFP